MNGKAIAFLTCASAIGLLFLPRRDATASMNHTARDDSSAISDTREFLAGSSAAAELTISPATEELNNSSPIDPIETTDRPHIPREFFDKKYHDISDEQINEMRIDVEARYFVAQESALGQRFASGKYECDIMPAFSIDKIPLPPEAPTRGLVRSQSTELLQDGRRLAKTTYLPWEEYPEVYELADELNWLVRKAARGSDPAHR